MTGFNMPLGCSPSMIPGNRPEDIAYEQVWEWAEQQFMDFRPEEIRRAILMGKAAVLAEGEEIGKLCQEWRDEGKLDAYEEMQG